MLAELVELGKRVRKGHDALKEEKCSLDIVIDKNGNYKELIPCNDLLVSEYIPSTAKKGKARFLLDNADYTLGYEASQHKEMYIEKLNQYKDISDLGPIFLFYSKSNEVEKALTDFMAFPQKERTGNMTFFYEHNQLRPLSLECVQDAIKSKMNDGELKEEKCSFEIVIDKNGEYKELRPCNAPLVSEYIPSTAKKREARFLLDSADYTLGYGKQNMYLEKLNQYKDLSVLSPIFLFYSNPGEVGKALTAFKALSKSKRAGNMTFFYEHDKIRPLSLECVQDAIIKNFEKKLNNNDNDVCSICGKTNYPILDEPHGGVSLPGSDKSCSLVSYNTNAFESYNLKGNLNSGICTNCARNYIEALRYLVGNGHEIITEKGERKFRYSNRQKISDDTIALFWTKEQDNDIDPFSDICQPTEERVRRLFKSIVTGECERVNTDMENFFYCCTISSAAARIAVRDWMAISVSQYQKNLKQWFDDIATVKDGETTYPGINSILNSCIKKKTKPTQSDAKAKARIGTILWHAALTNTSFPLMILQSVLTQIEHGNFSLEKSTIIRLVLNRNLKKTYYMNKELDEQNESKAYLCGRLFALICKLQFRAQGEVNSSMRDRFFASASNNPGRVIGGILLTKYVPVYQKNTKGAYTKSIAEIVARIESFPKKLTLTERGEFALGYYYQFSASQNEKK